MEADPDRAEPGRDNAESLLKVGLSGSERPTGATTSGSDRLALVSVFSSEGGRREIDGKSVRRSISWSSPE